MRKTLIKVSVLVLILLCGFNYVKAINDARLLRYPDINKDMIVFVYAGDIWSVDSNGGDAKRLTSHKGLELFPKISPDGKWIAFSAQYSGSRQVYVMPSTGGTPKQLTYYNDVGMMPPRGGFDNVVLDWTPDSKNILFRANRTPFGKRVGKYYKISIDGGMEIPLQLTEGGFGVYSPDATKLCYAPISREFRTWKRYKGGRAADLWIYDLKNDESEKITNFEGTDQIPVWYKDKIYFASDRDLRLNIYSYDINTKDINQITHHSKYDVMWPSGENGSLAYEMGGYIYKIDLVSGESKKVSVNINYDNPNILPYYKNVKEYIHSYAISPAGNRALFDARGDIFSVPAKNGNTVNLTQTAGVREMYPAWSPDGKYISYISDKTGEYEIYLLENKKNSEPKQITQNSSAWKNETVWSPDSKFMVFSDRTLKLKLLNLETQELIAIDKANQNEIRDYKFSPDSKWITYTKNADNGQSAIWVYNIETKENNQLTDNTFSDMSPVFSLCGDYIFFISNRDYNLSFSDFEFNYVYNKANRIYALALRKDSHKLFKYKNDEVAITEKATTKKEEKSKRSKKNDSKKDVLSISIDFNNISSRIMDFPIHAGDYYNLEAVKGGLLYIDKDGIRKYDIAKEKDEMVLKGCFQGIVTADSKKLLYRLGDDYGIAKIAPNQKAAAGKLSLDGLEMKIYPKKEWEQVYADGWRIFRDYFYEKNMHGVDWEAVKDNYSQLLPYVSHRADLDYIFGEIISEMNVGHAYDNYGDFEKVKRIETGLLGAELSVDKNANRYVIKKIYKGENWNDNRRSPLTEQGVNVKDGDYIIAINGKNITLADNPYKFLENTVGKVVEITVNNKPVREGARDYDIKPIKSEQSLFYINWVEARRKMVDKLSGGKIGYIHVPNTSFEGNRELFRGMYAYNDKEALIIDDRYNGGGFIPDIMTDLLNRKTLSYWHRRNLQPMKTPGIAHDGPKVMLINYYSSSGGDAFPYYFRKKGIGKIIGTRTWGGLVGMMGNASLVDGGYIAVPQFGIFNENGEWIIEGIGVYPDIEVIDKPNLVAKGQDPTIEKAVEVLLKQLKEHPVKKVVEPKEPNRSKWIEK